VPPSWALARLRLAAALSEKARRVHALARGRADTGSASARGSPLPSRETADQRGSEPEQQHRTRLRRRRDRGRRRRDLAARQNAHVVARVVGAHAEGDAPAVGADLVLVAPLAPPVPEALVLDPLRAEPIALTQAPAVGHDP